MRLTRTAHLERPVVVAHSTRKSSVPPGMSWKRCAAVVVLVLLPFAVYWPALWHHFGFRDDYSILREAVEEPGKIFRVCSMQARPIYGWLLEPTFRAAADIEGLAWIRAGCAAVIGVLAAAFFVLLRTLRFDRWSAFLMAALLTVVPSAQITIGWAVAWPLAAALLLAFAGFACAERAFRQPGPWTLHFGAKHCPWAVARGAAWWCAAAILVTASALTYQPNTLFYLAGVAAALWARRRQPSWAAFEWLVRHVLTLGIGLITAFTLMIVAFADGSCQASRRVAFEQDWLAKLEWFVARPLQNALGLVLLNHDGGERIVQRFAVLVGLAIAAGMLRLCYTRGLRQGAWWIGAVLVLVVGSFSVNLLVADRWPAYRVILPLTATVLVALTVSFFALGGRMLARGALIALLLPGLWLARSQTFELLAWPQEVELNLLAAGAKQIDPAKRPSVFVITPGLEDHVGADVFLDEFGSLSTNSYWTPKEMLMLLMHERFPAMPDVTERYSFSCGPALPRDGKFDVVIDLRRLREFRPAD